ncbi:glycosyltransferase family 2 protein [Mangrovimonas aestuarii]|uniref:glycosyltransferase family 2 protein n=1 Tax=Mangrovimonas aestuarii TaxID=3018443 RepID=UPI002379A609|nr:glycosyltransferase family A protein [Mangrovimonas aestuarii]
MYFALMIALFDFLKYLQPTHYFLLPKENGAFIYPIPKVLPDHIKQRLQVDEAYENEEAKDYDLSWQAIQIGYIGDAPCYNDFKDVCLKDNYRFIRKQFHRAWVFYVFVLRIVSGKNPFREFSAWYVTRQVKQMDYSIGALEYSGLVTEKSHLLETNPKVSVVIPTLNRYEYLRDVLIDLQQQDFKNIEVLVIDQSEPFKKDFYKGFDLDLHVTYQEEKALWLARNTAVKQAKGVYILLYDDDSRVEPNWISEHLRALDYFNADISSGVSISKVGAPTPKHYSYFKVSDQLDTGNVMIKKEVFEVVGLFDRQFEKQRMGDGEFGLRAHQAGFLNVSNPKAKRLHLKVDSGGLRQMGSWDAFRPKSIWSPRPIPSVLYLFRNYFGNKQARLALLRNLPMSVVPYRFKKNKFMLTFGAVLSVLMFPIVLFQLGKSWYLADIKLKEGHRIERLT